MSVKVMMKQMYCSSCEVFFVFNIYIYIVYNSFFQTCAYLMNQ
jgi:hypothetical protein